MIHSAGHNPYVLVTALAVVLIVAVAFDNLFKGR